MGRICRIALGAMAVIAPAAVHAQDIGEFVGCYAVRSGDWSDPARHARISGASVPDTLRLRAEQSESVFGQGRLALDPLGPFEGSRGGSAFWNVEGGSVQLTWTTGSSGLVVRAERRGDQLVGAVESFWDDRDGVPAPRASFEATKIECVTDERGLGDSPA